MIGDPLDLPLRKRIYDFVRVNPGAHFRQIQRVLDLAVGQLDFHLNALVKGEVLVKQVESGNATDTDHNAFVASLHVERS